MGCFVKKKLEKKGVLFSVLAMLLSVLFFFLLIPSVDTPMAKKTEVAQARIYAINNDLSNMDAYFKDVLATTSPRAMDAMSDYVFNKSFINASELSCFFEQMATAGQYINYSLTDFIGQNISDIKVDLGSGILDTFPDPDPVPVPYISLPVTQFFYARNSSKLSTVTLRLGYLNHLPSCPVVANASIAVFIMNDLCGKPGRVLDTATTSQVFMLPDYDATVSFSFTKQYPVDRGEKLWIMVDTNYSKFYGGVCQYISSFDDPTIIPESNQTQIHADYFTAPRMDNYFIEHFGENLVNYTNDNLSINFSYKVDHLSLAQNTPWDVIATMNLSYYMSDVYSSWQKKSTVSAVVPILGLLDPLYVGGSRGIHNRTILRHANYSSIDVVKSNMTLFNLTYTQGLYIWTGQAPSFLMRYSNSTASSLLGIQSLVNGSWYNASNASFVDFHFWNGTFFNCSENKVYMPNQAVYGTYYGNFTIDKLSVAYYGFDHAGDSNFTLVGC